MCCCPVELPVGILFVFSRAKKPGLQKNSGMLMLWFTYIKYRNAKRCFSPTSHMECIISLSKR